MRACVLLLACAAALLAAALLPCARAKKIYDMYICPHGQFDKHSLTDDLVDFEGESGEKWRAYEYIIRKFTRCSDLQHIRELQIVFRGMDITTLKPILELVDSGQLRDLRFIELIFSDNLIPVDELNELLDKIARAHAKSMRRLQLMFNGCQINDIKGVARIIPQFFDLETLIVDFSNNKIISIAGLRDSFLPLKKLTYLALEFSSNKIYSLDPLEYAFENLENVESLQVLFQDNQLTDMTPLYRAVVDMAERFKEVRTIQRECMEDSRYEPETCREHRETQAKLVHVLFVVEGNRADLSQQRDRLRDKLHEISRRMHVYDGANGFSQAILE